MNSDKPKIFSQMSKYHLAILCCLLLIALVVRVIFFNTSITYLPTTTDEALAALMAEAIANGARPLLFWGTPYQFPIESYLMSLFKVWLPSTAFGARIVLAILGTLSVFGFLYLFLLTQKGTKVIFAALLILIPSAYITTLQSAYFIPQYTMTATWAWIIPLLTLIAMKKESSAFWAACTGLASGLALSNHLLSIPLVASISLFICLGHSFRSAIRNTAVYLPSLLVGLIPYMLVYQKVQAAAGSVHGSLPIQVALKRFFSPLLSENLKVLLGVNLSVLPDFSQWRGYLAFLEVPVLIFFWLTLAICTWMRSVAFFKRLKQDNWPTLEVQDVFLATTGLSLLAYCASPRGMIGEYRYLLPAAWYFPFLLAQVLSVTWKTARVITITAITTMIAINLAYTATLIDTWRDPKLAAKSFDLPKIGKVRRYLTKNDIKHCYASFWHANRFTFQTQKELICSPPLNDRFPGWPLPFKESVDNAPRAAFVLNNSKMTRFKASEFEAILKKAGIQATKKAVPGFSIYHDFFLENSSIPHSEVLNSERMNQ